MRKKLISLFVSIVMILSIVTTNPGLAADARDGVYRHELSQGVQNIVKRAYQMTDISWTPLADIDGWNSEIKYKAGETYKGLPYGQPVYASYVPWSTNLNGFAEAVNDPGSKMYTSYSSYDSKAPYYSCDCSSFVSWAWGLQSRQTTSTIKNFATKVSDTDYYNAEVGDCLCLAGSHVVLITDITYDSENNINGIEISESTVNRATNYCCQRTWYGDGHSHSLAEIQSKYFEKGYILYRCNTRDNVSYTHSCASPLEGDSCSLCGYGSYIATPVCAYVTAAEDITLHNAPGEQSEELGTVFSGNTITISAFSKDDSGIVWYKTEDAEWLKASQTNFISYKKSVSVSGASFPSGNLGKGNVFPVEGKISSTNPISNIYAAIYKADSVGKNPVQEYSLPLSNTFSYSLKSSPIDCAMAFNDLAVGNYTFSITITETAKCNDREAEMITTTQTSNFSVVSSTADTSNAYRGIDVSKYQGTIDWDTVSKNVDFAIIRCGYGDDMTSQDDSQWLNNVKACTRLGIPFGVYIYSYAETDAQALSEAQHVIRLLEGYNPTLPVYLDLEDSNTVGALSNADILRHAKIFCNAISEAGYKPGVYASLSWWTNRLTDSAYDSWSRWIAYWSSDAPNYPRGYDVWQYTDSGSVPGIGSSVDLDYLYLNVLPSACKHSNTYVVKTDETCMTDGELKTICSDCGFEEIERIPALGHACNQIVVVQPSCEKGGYTQHTCLRCGYSYKDAIVAPNGHMFVNGICSACGLHEGKTVIGDLSGDGEVTSADSVLLARYLADLIELNNDQLAAADLNGDGEVTSADSVMLARYLTGIVKHT